MKNLLGEHFAILIGIGIVGYAVYGTIHEYYGSAFIGLFGIAFIIVSSKYRRFSIPFANVSVERRRYQKPINPKYDRRIKRIR